MDEDTPPPVLFIPTDQFPSRYPCLSTKAAGRTIEKLAGGFVVADFSFHGAACAKLPCFRCPRGRRARLFVHLGLQQPPRYPPIAILSPAAIPPRGRV